MIEYNPLFLDLDNWDFSYAGNSPCIDAGDPTETDPDGSIRDIGARWFGDEIDSGDCNADEIQNKESSEEGLELIGPMRWKKLIYNPVEIPRTNQIDDLLKNELLIKTSCKPSPFISTIAVPDDAPLSCVIGVI